ncbi:MAG: tetratricopeptide repeat protein [Hydrogenophilus sp.]|nr:tetratricopeptide repeat protein [Hydrogenophilus sp.]
MDEFTGALPEREVRRWLERLIPSPAEPLWREAEAALTAGDRATAMAKLQEALSRDPAFDRARLRRIELLLEARQVAEARADFAALGDKTSEAARRLESRLALLDEEATGSLTALAEQVAANPKNWEARYRLARGYAAEGRFAEALEMALAIVEGNRQWNEDAARKLMLQIFEAMQPDDPVVREYRVRLANALNR